MCSFSRIRYSATAMKSSNTFCLLLEMTRLVPRFTVLRPAAHVRGHPDAAGLEPCRHVGSICRQHADRKPAVAVHHRRDGCRRVPIPLRQVRKNGTRVPSLRHREQAPRLVLRRVDRRLGRFEWHARARLPDRSEKHGRWKERRRERVEDLRRVSAAADGRHGARAGKRDRPRGVAVRADRRDSLLCTSTRYWTTMRPPMSLTVSMACFASGTMVFQRPAAGLVTVDRHTFRLGASRSVLQIQVTARRCRTARTRHRPPRRAA